MTVAPHMRQELHLGPTPYRFMGPIPASGTEEVGAGGRAPTRAGWPQRPCSLS